MMLLTPMAAFASPKKAPHPKAHGTVNVLYAGSLVGLMTKYLAPQFTQATGYSISGLPGGSDALVNDLKGGLEKADVFISASPKADVALEGKANHNLVSWYSLLGSSPLVVGYNPASQFAGALKHHPWWRVMQNKGFRLGRTDPLLDPKGVLSVALVKAEAKKQHSATLAQAILGPVENQAQVFPEETLVSRLETGQLDAGFFYLNEARLAGIPTVATGLPYAAKFTVTILSNASNSAGAEAFVRYLYSAPGRHLLSKYGVESVKTKVVGDKKMVPVGLRGVLER